MVWWFGRLVAWLFVWAFGQFVVCLCVWLVGWLVGWLVVRSFGLPLRPAGHHRLWVRQSGAEQDGAGVDQVERQGVERSQGQGPTIEVMTVLP